MPPPSRTPMIRMPLRISTARPTPPTPPSPAPSSPPSSLTTSQPASRSTALRQADAHLPNAKPRTGGRAVLAFSLARQPLNQKQQGDRYDRHDRNTVQQPANARLRRRPRP